MRVVPQPGLPTDQNMNSLRFVQDKRILHSATFGVLLTFCDLRWGNGEKSISQKAKVQVIFLMGTLILIAMSNEHMNMMHMSLFKSCYQIGPMFKLMLIRSVANGHIHRQTCLRIIRQSFTVVLLNSMIFASDSESSGNFLNVALLSSQYQSQILGRNLRAPCLSIYHILTSLVFMKTCGAAWPRRRASMAHWAAPCGSVLWSQQNSPSHEF